MLYELAEVSTRPWPPVSTSLDENPRVQVRRVTLAAVLIPLVVWVAEPLVGQTPNPATESVTVRGRVVAADTGEAIANARVTISGTPVSVRTNLEGRFAIAAPRTATLLVSKAGYLRAETPVAAAADIRMTRAAISIAGGQVQSVTLRVREP
jgi:hypothetical protein